MRATVFTFLIVVVTLNSCRKERFDDAVSERLIGEWSSKTIEVFEWDDDNSSINTVVSSLDASSVIKLSFIERGKLELFQDNEKLSARRVPHWAYHHDVSNEKGYYDLTLSGSNEGFTGDDLSLFFNRNVLDTFRVEAGYLNIINECDYLGSHGLNYVFVKE